MSNKRFRLSTLGYISLFSLASILTGCGGAGNATDVVKDISEALEAKKEVSESVQSKPVQQALDQTENDTTISTTRHTTPHTSVTLKVSDINSKDKEAVLVDLTDYSDVKLAEYTPEQNAQFSNFTPYTLTIDQPVPELVNQEVVYLKVIDDHGNQLYLGALPLDQIMDLDFELEVGVEILHLQLFADGLETIIGVVTL